MESPSGSRKTNIGRVPGQTVESWHSREGLLDHWSDREWTEGLQIDSLDDLDTLCVRTCNSQYEITILSKCTGEVMVRGGRFFPERTMARLAGSSLGGSFLKMGGIYLDFGMEFQHEGRRIVTSRVQSIGMITEF